MLTSLEAINMHGFLVVEYLRNTVISLNTIINLIMNFFHVLQENKYNRFITLKGFFHAYKNLFIYENVLIRENEYTCLVENVCIFQNKFSYN